KNGFLFVLFVLRTATPVGVASALFVVKVTFGERAFPTWLEFLAGSLRSFVCLPTVPEVVYSAPPSFERAGMGRVVQLLSTIEVEVASWPEDAADLFWSAAKHRHTGKAVIGVTPAGKTLPHI
ncbi:unnamed protein product, partial [Laminaria digitata]